MNKFEIASLEQSTKRRRISQDDVQAIADLCSIRLTEKEACCHVGIDYSTWNSWKNRNGNIGQFAQLLSRVRTAKVQGLVREIERHGHGDKKRGIRADWRALDRVLTITDQRYSDRAPQGPPLETDALADTLLSRMLEKAYAPKRVAATPEDVVVDATPLADETADLGGGI